MSDDDKPSYWQAFLFHRRNQMLVLGVTAASVLASFPLGGDALALGLLGLAALEMIGLAIVPGLPNFQLAVNERVRREQREARRETLLREVHSHGGSNHLRSFEQMCDRVASLYRTASDRSTSLTTREVEQLDDLTLDYLRMCVSDAVLRSPQGNELVSSVQRKLRAVDERLAGDRLDQDEQAQLRRAKAEYEEALARQARIASRRSALEATLVAMPIRLEEVYQMVMSAPRDGNLGQMLEESMSKLKLAEQAALDIERPYELAGIGAIAADREAAQAAARRAIGQRH
ncbi:MAG TPA: hypothetical protein VGQ91_07115 [Ideonella sp.]|jgi:hypothetical protein|nr:hypothetical protein [Ideonella sp.]